MTCALSHNRKKLSSWHEKSLGPDQDLHQSSSYVCSLHHKNLPDCSSWSPLASSAFACSVSWAPSLPSPNDINLKWQRLLHVHILNSHLFSPPSANWWTEHLTETTGNEPQDNIWSVTLTNIDNAPSRHKHVDKTYERFHGKQWHLIFCAYFCVSSSIFRIFK